MRRIHIFTVSLSVIAFAAVIGFALHVRVHLRNNVYLTTGYSDADWYAHVQEFPDGSREIMIQHRRSKEQLYALYRNGKLQQVCYEPYDKEPRCKDADLQSRELLENFLSAADLNIGYTRNQWKNNIKAVMANVNTLLGKNGKDKFHLAE